MAVGGCEPAVPAAVCAAIALPVRAAADAGEGRLRQRARPLPPLARIPHRRAFEVSDGADAALAALPPLDHAAEGLKGVVGEGVEG